MCELSLWGGESKLYSMAGVVLPTHELGVYALSLGWWRWLRVGTKVGRCGRGDGKGGRRRVKKKILRREKSRMM